VFILREKKNLPVILKHPPKISGRFFVDTFGQIVDLRKLIVASEHNTTEAAAASGRG
jgi:hypothetical protein